MVIETLSNTTKELERLSGIFKGILEYKKDQETLEKLVIKYRYESVKLVKDKYPYDCLSSAYA
jgi:hypothetical protein